jgi:hypothetical protein
VEIAVGIGVGIAVVEAEIAVAEAEIAVVEAEIAVVAGTFAPGRLFADIPENIFYIHLYQQEI